MTINKSAMCLWHVNAKTTWLLLNVIVNTHVHSQNTKPNWNRNNTETKLYETLKDTMGTEKNLLGSDKYNRAQGKQSTFHFNFYII